MTIIAEIVIPTDHPTFSGHFPGAPIVPGVVLLDETLHAIARLSGVVVERCTLSAVKFRNVVRPGRAVTLHYDFVGAGGVRFELRSGATIVASGSLKVAAADATADAR